MTPDRRPLVEMLGEADAPLLARGYYADGDPGPITATLAQVPEMLDVTMPFLGAVLGPSSIDVRTKELVILRTSAVMNCRYCVAAHTPVAIDAGLGRFEVEALRAERSVAESFERQSEQALLAWVDAVAGGIGPVDDEVAQAFRDAWPSHHVVELTLLIGATMLLNRYCSALGLPTAPSTIERLRREGYEQ